jgi:hypothetical protein
MRLGAGLDLQREGRLEGFSSWQAFEAAWAEMHGEEALDEVCHRVEFELVEALT